MDANHEFEDHIVQDQDGNDTAERTSNEKIMGDVNMILIDKSTMTSTTNAKGGGAFLGPLAIVTITLCDLAFWNTTWQIVSGSSIKLKNSATGVMLYKMRRYVDSAQNTLMSSIPS